MNIDKFSLQKKDIKKYEIKIKNPVFIIDNSSRYNNNDNNNDNNRKKRKQRNTGGYLSL